MFEMLCRYTLEISDVTLGGISSIIETAELERKEDFMTLGQRLREEGMEIGLLAEEVKSLKKKKHKHQ